MKKFALAIGLSALSLSLAGNVGQATAQSSPQAAPKGGSGFSGQGGPVDISADRNENFQQQHKSVWQGNVVAIQGDQKLLTPLLTVYFSDSAARATQSASAAPNMGKIDRMEAEGPVYLVTPTQRAQADHATYVAATDTVIMTGNVVLLQEKNVVKGEKLVIEHTTGHSTLYASPKAENGRVRGVFYPKQDSDAPAKPR
jgi:lipopolysaccharide export system protein LptA